jgi:hypothetical protein
MIFIVIIINIPKVIYLVPAIRVTVGVMLIAYQWRGGGGKFALAL